MPPALFLLRIALAIWSSVVLNKFRILILWRCLWYFDGDCMDYVEVSGSMAILTIQTPPIHEQEMSLHLFVLWFLKAKFCSFHFTDLSCTLHWLKLFPTIVFHTMVNGKFLFFRCSVSVKKCNWFLYVDIVFLHSKRCGFFFFFFYWFFGIFQF